LAEGLANLVPELTRSADIKLNARVSLRVLRIRYQCSLRRAIILRSAELRPMIKPNREQIVLQIGTCIVVGVFILFLIFFRYYI
jgi:hypothetical protein